MPLKPMTEETRTMDRDKLLELAERVALDDVGSRDLDAAIAMALGADRVHVRGNQTGVVFRGEDEEPLPFYSTSLDAAMTLGSPRHVEWCDGFVEACCFGDEYDSAVYVGKATTPALALTAACLRAMAANYSVAHASKDNSNAG